MRYLEDIVVGEVKEYDATEVVFSFENAALVECRPADGPEGGG